MIRIAKTNEIPASLTTTKAYDGEDVKKQLFADQLSKCYLCERVVSTDFQIEHLKSWQAHPVLRTEWRNLLLSCNYCNQKKGCRFDNIINPLESNVEDIIEQRIDYVSKRATFESKDRTSEVEATIRLLDKIFNGESKLRKLKEEKFYEEVVFGDEALDYSNYITYYESIDAENAAELYKEAVQQEAQDEELDDYAKTYAAMKPKQAAAIFESMTNNLKLVAEILEHMDTDSRAKILDQMDSEIAASITNLMAP